MLDVRQKKRTQVFVHQCVFGCVRRNETQNWYWRKKSVVVSHYICKGAARNSTWYGSRNLKNMPMKKINEKSHPSMGYMKLWYIAQGAVVLECKEYKLWPKNIFKICSKLSLINEILHWKRTWLNKTKKTQRRLWNNICNDA